MVEKMNGLSPEFIIHPGETIKEILEEISMKQEELAIRTGFSPKHVSEVINGKKGISPSFAKSLEYVFGMPASFWINLQGIYDKEILEYKEKEGIEKEEIDIAKTLVPLIKYAENKKIFVSSGDIVTDVIKLRKFCNVNNLKNISELMGTQIAFRKSQTIKTNVYVLYMWLKICKTIAEKEPIETEYSRENLVQNLCQIKSCMFLEINEAINKLKEIFSECGIVFQVVENFKGAPVQGFISSYNNKVILSMTIRGSFADIFWFTLFHEIGHLLNGDLTNNDFVDFANLNSNKEVLADKFASRVLINEKEYNKFLSKEKISQQDVLDFAKEQNVKPFVLVGKLQRDKNDYSLFSKLKERYKWK